MAGGIQRVKKSRTTSAVHVEIGNWKSNPNRQLEEEMINRYVRHAIQGETPSSGHT
jgi:hypothetical protein